jgi:hypothetical protein
MDMSDTRNLDLLDAPRADRSIASRPILGRAVLTANSLLPIAIGFLFFAMQCCRYFYLFRRADDSKLTQWLPDDAFYYLILGRNFALLHRWTFDGVAPATGFHLLWGYMMALIYWLAPSISLHQIFTLLYFFVAFLMATSLALTCVMVQRFFGPFAVLGPVATFCTSSAVQQPNFLMESGLVSIFSCLAIYIVLGNSKPPANSLTLAAAFAVGLLGMLSRSDFGLLPLVVLLACVAMDRQVQSPRVKLAGCVLTGSILGLVLVLGHTYLASGHLTQSSARVKRHWSALDLDRPNLSARHAIWPLLEGRDSSARSSPMRKRMVYVAGAALLFPAIAGAAIAKRRRRAAITIVGAAAGVILGYIALYTYDSAAVQVWYFANYLVPYSVLAASAFAIPGREWRTLSTAVLAIWIWTASPIRKSWTPIWPQQIGFYQAGIYLRDHPEISPIGAWNAGILSYVARRAIVNLDGLVNDDAVADVVSNSLKNYLAEKHIHHVIDDAIMWDSDMTRARGGYAGDVLTRCIQSKTTLWQTPNPRLVGDHILLSTLDPQCLSAIDSRSQPTR